MSASIRPETNDEACEALARHIFAITMICVGLYIGSVFLLLGG